MFAHGANTALGRARACNGSDVLDCRANMYGGEAIFEDRGYLTIPESVLLDKGGGDKGSPSKEGALCPDCVKKQLALHRE